MEIHCSVATASIQFLRRKKNEKLVLVVLIVILGLLDCFAAGGIDGQGVELFLKQKRLKHYNNSPDSAAFYECYLIRTDDIEDDKASVILLDVTEIKNNIVQGILEKKQMFFDSESSKEIYLMGGASKLVEKNTVYKCVVFYTGQFYGYVMGNLFEATLPSESILMVKNLDWFREDAHFYFDMYHAFIDVIIEDINDFQYTAFEREPDKIILFDTLPAPSKSKEQNIKGLLQAAVKKVERQDLPYEYKKSLIDEYTEAINNPKIFINNIISYILKSE